MFYLQLVDHALAGWPADMCLVVSMPTALWAEPLLGLVYHRCLQPLDGHIDVVSISLFVFRHMACVLFIVDTLVHWKESRHIVVYNRGRYYKVVIYHKDQLLKPCQIEMLVVTCKLLHSACSSQTRCYLKLLYLSLLYSEALSV